MRPPRSPGARLRRDRLEGVGVRRVDDDRVDARRDQGECRRSGPRCRSRGGRPERRDPRSSGLRLIEQIIPSRHPLPTSVLDIPSVNFSFRAQVAWPVVAEAATSRPKAVSVATAPAVRPRRPKKRAFKVSLLLEECKLPRNRNLPNTALQHVCKVSTAQAAFVQEGRRVMQNKAKLNRRRFIGTAAGAAAGASLSPWAPGALAHGGRGHGHGGDRLLPKDRIAVQLFTLRNRIAALGVRAGLQRARGDRLQVGGVRGLLGTGHERAEPDSAAGDAPERRETSGRCSGATG